jgi:hypothetical protein
VEALLTALSVKVDDEIGGTRWMGTPPLLSNSELVCLAVAQALLGYHSEARWLRYANKHLSGMFPYLPLRPGCNKRLRAALPLVKRMIRELAMDSDFWFDNHWIVDSTPLPCGMSRPTVQRSNTAGWAQYGYCASHSAHRNADHVGAGARRCWPGACSRRWPGACCCRPTRGFLGFDLARAAAATGADLLWRVKSNAVPPVVASLPDVSYLSEIVAARDKNRRTDPALVRVIEYTPGPRGKDGTVYRLVTTILDPDTAPAVELAALYAERCQDTSGRAPSRPALPASGRGRAGDLRLSARAPRAARPDASSRTAGRPRSRPDLLHPHLCVAHRHVTGQAALSPSRLARALTATLREIRERLLPPRRLRSNPR